MFTCREGASATQLGGLKHGLPLRAAHLNRLAWAVGQHNKQDGGQKNRFGGKLIFFTFAASGPLFRAVLMDNFPFKQK